MNEYGILNLLDKFSAEIVIISIIVFIVTKLVKTFCKKIPAKILNVFPFVFACILYAIYLLIFAHSINAETVFEKGTAIGGISLLLSSSFDNLVTEKNDYNFVENLLLGISGVNDVNGVFKKLTENETELTAETVKEILKTEITGMSEEKLNALAEIIVNLIKPKN